MRKPPKVIKGCHVLVVGAGSSIVDYKDKILDFIKNENGLIIFGCNYMPDFICPDYHFWGDVRRYKKWGKSMKKTSIPVFSSRWKEKDIRKIWKEAYITIKFTKRTVQKVDKVAFEKGIMYGRFRTIGAVAILWAYVNMASKISVIGMDGYSLYGSKEYKSGQKRQHFYERGKDGYTDKIAQADKFAGMLNNRFNRFCRKKDREIYQCLYSLRDFGVIFKILTPTVYKDFHNLDFIKEDCK